MPMRDDGELIMTMMTRAMVVAMFFTFFTTIASLVWIRFVNYLTNHCAARPTFPSPDSHNIPPCGQYQRGG